MQQCFSKFFYPVWVFQFLVVLINNIEHIDHLIDMGGDSGEMNFQFMVEQRVSERVKQTLTVAGKDIDDCKSF